MKIGIVCGSFDLLHRGHLRLLRNAAMRCDQLIVGVNSDARILAAKQHAPIMCEDDRLEIIRELRIVYDAFVIENGIEMVRILISRGVTPHEYYRGDDGANNPEQSHENEILKSYGVTPIYFEHTRGIHSTDLRNKINTKDRR